MGKSSDIYMWPNKSLKSVSQIRNEISNRENEIGGVWDKAII